MATITLDQLREDVDNAYGDYAIDLGEDGVCRLRNAMRLSKEERRELRAMQKRYESLEDERDKLQTPLSDEEKQKESAEDLERKERAEEELEDAITALFFDQIRLLADNKSLANRLLKEIGEDQAILMHLIQQYMEKTQPGEASPSQS